MTSPMPLVGAAGVPIPMNPAGTLPIPLITERRPVWRGRPNVNGCAVPAAVVEPTARVTCGLGIARFRPPPLTKRETEVQMCRVLNKHAAARYDGAIYIGRGSKWGNPFRIGVDGDRAAVIAKHARWLRDQHHLLRRARRASRQESAVLLRSRGMPWRSAAAARERDAQRTHRVVALGGVIAARTRRPKPPRAGRWRPGPPPQQPGSAALEVEQGLGGRDGLEVAREARGARRGDPRCHVQPLALAPSTTGRASIPKSPTRSSPSWKPAACRGSNPGGRRPKAPIAMPKNAATQRRYSGVNVLILWGAVIGRGFAGQSWLTFRQALSLGGNVRKGEQGTTLVYADRFIPDDERKRAERGRRRTRGDSVPQAIHRV